MGVFRPDREHGEGCKLAEFIVAMAIGEHEGLSVPWDKYDLMTSDGIRIEVKASGYIQTWEQARESKIVFGIPPSCGWNYETNLFDSNRKRHSDVYVFCVLKHKDQDTVNALDMNQWEFWVLSTAVLNEQLPNQKSITLRRVEQIGAVQCDFHQLLETINTVHKT